MIIVERAGVRVIGRDPFDTDEIMAAVMIVAGNPALSDDEAVQAFRHCERLATTFVERPDVRAAIEAVMSDLVERGAMTGDEVRAIVRAALPSLASCIPPALAGIEHRASEV